MSVFSRFARYFDEVERQGSIRKAAEKLRIAPSAVDRQILKFEEELGTPLFERRPQGLRLTAAGEILIHGLRRWTQDFDRARSQIEDLRGLRRGRVVLAVVEATADLVPSLIAGFHRSHPRISYQIVVAGSDQVTELVLSREAELGLTFNPPAGPALRVERSARFRLGLVVPPGHPLAGRERLRLADCAGHPVVLPDAQLSLRRVVDEALARTGVRLDPVASCNSIALLKSLVRQGLGVGLLTELDVMPERAAGDLVYLPLQDAGIAPSALTLCVAADRHLSVAAGLLSQHIGKALEALAAG